MMCPEFNQTIEHSNKDNNIQTKSNKLQNKFYEN